MLKRGLAFAIALACNGPAAFALEKITPAEAAAGAPFEIEFEVPADALAVTVAAPEAPWRSFLPATFGAGLALFAAAGLLGAIRARRQRALAKALERGPLKDYKSGRAGRS